MMRAVALTMMTCVSGCESGTVPEGLAAGSTAMFCIINCPLSVTVADDSYVTDATPIEHPHLLVDNIRAINEGRGNGSGR